ncbi:MAG: flagellar hook-basal body protein [Oscillospiraceae bacterium]|nr:flagellar hook-basal body protein [Oscillospiraceae bacterium]
MFQPLHTGRLGLTGQQRNVDVIGNNIANINTTGYKKSRLDFQDNLYTRMFNKVDNGPHMNLQRGTGIRPYQTARILEQGALQSTGRPLDFALEGPGFFIVENPNPMDEEDYLDEFLYTRSGTFYISVEDTENYLVDAFGRYVLDESEMRISIPNPDALQADASGLLFMLNDAGETVEIARLGIADFVNPGGLNAVGEGTFAQTVNSGDILEDIPVAVQQGFVEASNVDLAEEMTRMIRAQRAYQIAARCVSTADQMMQVANAIRS